MACTAEKFLLVIFILVIARLWMVQNATAENKRGHFVTMNYAGKTTRNNPINLDCPQWQSNYKVSFIYSDLMTKGRGDMYSGMWWQSVDTMLRTNYSVAVSREGITFRSFNNANQVLSTSDWLDMSVEHLSTYVKHFRAWDRDDKGVGLSIQNRVAELIEGYIAKSKVTCHHEFGSSTTRSAASSTIAILPLFISSGEETYENRLVTLQVAATVASLWNIGFERAVIVGVSENESLAARRTGEILKEHLMKRSMELEYVHLAVDDVSHNEKGFINVPREAMVQLQMAFRHSRRRKGRGKSAGVNVSSWLGSNPSRWRYAYFTEPDLILRVRPEAVPHLSEELEKGNLLAAHRLKPLPHMHQFSDIYSNATSEIAARMEGQLLPDAASFAAVHQLDEASGDACCDQGKFYPSNREDPSKPLAVRKVGRCHTDWVHCGYSRTGNHSSWSLVLEKHGLLLTSPFISFERGTGLPLVHAGQRVCVPKRGPSEGSCHLTSASKRS